MSRIGYHRTFFMAFLLFLFVVIFFNPCRTSTTDFDSSEWKNCHDGDCAVRSAMLDDLLRTHPLIGMPKNVVLLLLGDPDAFHINDEKKYLIEYKLGIDQSSFLLRKNHLFLVIYFESNIAVNFEVQEG